MSVRRLSILGVLGIILLVTFGQADTRPSLAQAPQQVGAAAPGQSSLELVGKIDQDGVSFNGYGYLTYVDGIPDAVLFTDSANRNEATARFTFVSTASFTGRSVVDTLFVLGATGTTTIYYNETPKADFKDPKTFGTGTAIAVGSERWQNIVNVQAPDTAIETGIGIFTQTSANPFKLAGKDYVLGKPNQVLRFWFTGEGKRTDKTLPRSTLVVAGYATAGGNE
jgi:hypothetical protein